MFSGLTRTRMYVVLSLDHIFKNKRKPGQKILIAATPGSHQ